MSAVAVAAAPALELTAGVPSLAVSAVSPSVFVVYPAASDSGITFADTDTFALIATTADFPLP